MAEEEVKKDNTPVSEPSSDPLDDLFPGALQEPDDKIFMDRVLKEQDDAPAPDEKPDAGDEAEQLELSDAPAPDADEPEKPDDTAGQDDAPEPEQDEPEQDEGRTVSMQEYRALQEQYEQALAKLNGTDTADDADEAPDPADGQDPAAQQQYQQQPGAPRVIQFSPFEPGAALSEELGAETASALGNELNKWVAEKMIPEVAAGILQFLPQQQHQRDAGNAVDLTRQILSINFMARYPQYRRMPNLVTEALRTVMREQPDIDDITLFERAHSELEKTDAKAAEVAKNGKQVRVDARNAKRESSSPGTGGRGRSRGGEDARSPEKQIVDELAAMQGRRDALLKDWF